MTNKQNLCITNDFLAFLNDIGFYDFNKLKSFKDEQNPENIESNLLRCFYFIGIGKSATLEGDLLTAQTYFKKAFKISDKFPDEIKGDYLSFLLYEYGLYMGLIGNYHSKLRLYYRGKVHAKSPVLKAYINYGITLHKTTDNFKPIIKVVNSLLDKGLIKTHAIGLQRIGVKYFVKGDYNQAESYYQRSLEFAKKYKINLLIQNVYNSIGLLKIRQSNYMDAINWYNQYVENVESHYTRVLMTENIGYAYYKMEKYEHAVSIFQKALAMSKAHNVISQLPDQCKYIADCYEKLGKIEQAHLFYKQGYDISMEQASMGLGLYGTRKTTIESYVDFMDRNSTLQTIKLRESLAFEYCLGKSWNEMLALFQYHLAVLHLSKVKKMESFYFQVDMNATTFYAIKNRLATFKLNLPSIKDSDKLIPEKIRIDALVIYIEKYLMDKSWKDANQQYENDLFLYLFKFYKYSRKKITESLQVTYPTVYYKVAAAIEAEDWRLNNTNQ